MFLHNCPKLLILAKSVGNFLHNHSFLSKFKKISCTMVRIQHKVQEIFLQKFTIFFNFRAICRKIQTFWKKVQEISGTCRNLFTILKKTPITQPPFFVSYLFRNMLCDILSTSRQTLVGLILQVCVSRENNSIGSALSHIGSRRCGVKRLSLCLTRREIPALDSAEVGVTVP